MDGSPRVCSRAALRSAFLALFSSFCAALRSSRAFLLSFAAAFSAAICSDTHLDSCGTTMTPRVEAMPVNK